MSCYAVQNVVQTEPGWVRTEQRYTGGKEGEGFSELGGEKERTTHNQGQPLSLDDGIHLMTLNP